MPSTPKTIFGDPAPDTAPADNAGSLAELTAKEAQIRAEIHEREKILADIAARKAKLMPQAKPETTPGWPGWDAAQPRDVVVSHIGPNDPRTLVGPMVPGDKLRTVVPPGYNGPIR